MSLPVSKGPSHGNEGVRRPGTDKQEEDCESDLRDPDLNTFASVLLVRSEGLHVHLLRLLLEHSLVEPYL